MTAENIHLFLVALSVGGTCGLIVGYIIGRLERHQLAALALAAACVAPAFSQGDEKP